MKAMILAGGFGTRLAEETDLRPKPMVEIGGRPIIWHIMQHYASHGVKDFIICLGYKGDYIKRFFLDYSVSLSDFTIDLSDRQMHVHKQYAEDWAVTLVDTGLHTMTGGRVRRAIDYVDPRQPFCLTYGDGLGDIDITASIEFHNAHGKKCIVTAVTPPGRFGVLDVTDDDTVNGFREEIASDQYRINGGFFVLDPSVREYIKDDATIWENEPMRRLAADGQMKAWNHEGFWQPMDTLRDKHHLEELWATGNPPWRS